MDKEYLTGILTIIAFFWLISSFMGSDIKREKDACGKDYYIDYFLATNLFCEIPESSDE